MGPCSRGLCVGAGLGGVIPGLGLGASSSGLTRGSGAVPLHGGSVWRRGPEKARISRDDKGAPRFRRVQERGFQCSATAHRFPKIFILGILDPCSVWNERI
jgi:hypothetical protein